MKRVLIIILMLGTAAIFVRAQGAAKPQTGAALKEETSPEVSVLLEQVSGLREQGKIEEAFKALEDALLKHREKTYDRYALLTVKFDLLSQLSKHREALAAAIEKANIVTSPRQALNVAKTYLLLNDPDPALEWLEASVERGLQSYTIFEEEIYKPLRDNPRYRRLAETVKKRNGLGLPAKPFAGKTVSGVEVSLDRYRGKVLLVDFWATWCPPCLAEMPNLITCYAAFKDRGFEIVGIAENDNDDTLKGYLEKNSIAWPIVSKGTDRYEAIVAAYAVKNIPASFLVDRQGILRQVNLTGEALRSAIENLLNEK